jgi:hypothetical protein
MGLGLVVEYANQRAEPQWEAPPSAGWDYTIFGVERPVPAPDWRIELVFEKVPGGRGGYNRWTLNGKSWPNTNPLFTVEPNMRYRIAMSNKSSDNHTRQASFEARREIGFSPRPCKRWRIPWPSNGNLLRACSRNSRRTSGCRG